MHSRSPAQRTAVPAAEKDSSGASPAKASLPEELACRNPPAGSYQQISCLDGVMRCGSWGPPTRAWHLAPRALVLTSTPPPAPQVPGELQ